MLDWAIREAIAGLLAAMVATEPAAQGDGIPRGKVARAGLEAAHGPAQWPAAPEPPPANGNPLDLRRWAIRRAAQDLTTVVKVYPDGSALVRFDPVQ
jgi:hypothetical protein